MFILRGRDDSYGDGTPVLEQDKNKFTLGNFQGNTAYEVISGYRITPDGKLKKN